jgi:hypothetical protein
MATRYYGELDDNNLVQQRMLKLFENPEMPSLS